MANVMSMSTVPWVLPCTVLVIFVGVAVVIAVAVHGTQAGERAVVLLAVAAVIRAAPLPWPRWSCSTRPGVRRRR